MWGIYRKIFLVLNRQTSLQALKNSKAFRFRSLPSIPSQERAASQFQPLSVRRRKRRKVRGITCPQLRHSRKLFGRDVPDAMFHPDFFFGGGFGLKKVLFLTPIKPTTGLWDSPKQLLSMLGAQHSKLLWVSGPFFCTGLLHDWAGRALEPYPNR